MSKISKILYQSAIAVNFLAGLASIITHNYILGINQFLVSWFVFLYYNEKNK